MISAKKRSKLLEKDRFKGRNMGIRGRNYLNVIGRNALVLQDIRC